MRKITITIWDDDITLRAHELQTELTRHQCQEVLRRLKKNHDMYVGICWDVIDVTISDVVTDRRFNDLSTPAPPVRKHRNTDPETSVRASHTKRPSLKLRLLTQIIYSGHGGLTGKEAEKIMHPVRLNSITPRFAELKREGEIYQTSIVRDGAYVWKDRSTRDWSTRN